MSVAGKQLWTPDPDITTEALDAMRVDVLDRIIVARIGLLLRHPFFGNMATRLRIKAADDWLPTAAVDGRNLFFNTQFFNALTNNAIKALTSCFGRFQFSVEKAYKVRYLIPISVAYSVASLTALTPFL